MRRWRADDGQVSAEYLGMLAVIAVVIGVLVLAPVGETVGTGIRTLICQIVGAGCEGDLAGDLLPEPCVLATSERSVSASVKVTFVKVGGSEGYIREERSDGTIHVTWVTDGEVAATAGAGVRGSIEIGGDGVRGGAHISGEVGVGATLGQTAVFTDPREAQRWIEAQRREAIRRHTGPLGAIDRLIRGGSPRQPDIVAFDVSGRVGGVAGAGFGPIGAQAEASGAVVLGGTYDRRNGETTLYIELTGEVSGSAGALLGVSGSASGSRVVALTLDASNRPTALTITSRTQTGQGGLLDGSGYTLDQLGEVLAEASANIGGEATHSVVVTSQLDLTDPRNAEAAAALLSASATAGLPGGGERLQEAADQLAARIEANGRVGVTEYEGTTFGLGAGLEVALGPKLGFDAGYDSADAALIAATYLDQLPDGSRAFVPWTACTG